MDRKAVWLIISTAIFGGLFMVRDSIAQRVANAGAHPNVRAFLAMIRMPESGGKYNVIYGGQIFHDYAKHPNVRVPFDNPRTGRRDYSTAAGAYQINSPTWLTIQAVAFLPDFSPTSQDTAAIWLLQLRGALDYILAGDFENGLRVAGATWASLPHSDSGQHKVSVAAVTKLYADNGGTFA